MHRLLALVTCAMASLPLTAAESFPSDPVTALGKGTISKCDATVVPAQGRPGKALRIHVDTLPEAGWMSHVYLQNLEQNLQAGDTIEVSLWARSVDGPEGALKVDLSLGERPYTPVISAFVMPTTEWRLHTVKGVVPADVAGAKTRFGLCVGYRAQTVEITDITLRKAPTH